MMRMKAVLSGCIVILINKDLVEGNCTDFKMQTVLSGHRFIPQGFDPCTTCTCVNGIPELCNSVLCSPPSDCLNAQFADNKCCEFMCKNSGNNRIPEINGTHIETEETEIVNTTNLGLRLVASTVTSFLILALLLFMIHRLRQRRLLLMIRRFNNNHLNTGLCDRHYTAGENGSGEHFSRQDHVTFSYFEDPPPPYTFWKPPDVFYSQREAPPPYEIALNTNHLVSPTSHSIPNNEGLITRFPLHSLNNISLHTNNFQMNDLGRERNTSQYSVSIPPLPLNVVGSVSSSSSHSDLNFQSNNVSNNDITESMAIRSDATYEQFPAYRSNEIYTGSNPSIASDVNHRDSDVMPSSTMVTSNNVKCHSCNDVAVCLRDISNQKNELPKKLKRYSLQSPVCGIQPSGTSYPESATWIGDASESSSSSSPSYEQQTASPTSSDSSSIDYHIANESDHNKLVCGLSKIPVQAYAANSNENTNSKHLLFEKTLGHLKKKVLLKKTTKLPSKESDRVRKKDPFDLMLQQKDLNVSPIPNGDIHDIQQASTSHLDADVYSCVPRISYVTSEEDCSEPFPNGEKQTHCSSSNQKHFPNYDFSNFDASEDIKTDMAVISKITPHPEGSLCNCATGLDRAEGLTNQTSNGQSKRGGSREDETLACESRSANNISPVHQLSAMPLCAGTSSHSRNVSICSETGEQKPINSCGSRSSDSVLSRNPVNRASIRHFQHIRSSVKPHIEKNESYI